MQPLQLTKEAGTSIQKYGTNLGWKWGKRSVGLESPEGLRCVFIEEKTLTVFSEDNMNKNASLCERGDKAKMKGIGIVASNRETQGHAGRFPLS